MKPAIPVESDYELAVNPNTVEQLRDTTRVLSQSERLNLEIEDMGVKRLKYEKMFIALTLMIVGCLVIHFAIVLVSIRLQFGDMISYIDNEVVAAGKSKSDPSGKSQYYSYSDGYTIAFYYKFPRLPMNPFLNTAFPASVVFSYYTKHYSDYFLRDPKYVQQMYIYSVIGSLNQCGEQDPDLQAIQTTCAIEPSAHQIICATYGTAAGLGDCKQVCRKDTSLGTYSMVGQIVAMGGLGAFAGGMTGKSAASGTNFVKGYGESDPMRISETGTQMGFAAVYATVGVTMGVVTSEMSKGENEEYQQSLDAGYCEQPGT